MAELQGTACKDKLDNDVVDDDGGGGGVVSTVHT
jgi:hypothetical protein